MLAQLQRLGSRRLDRHAIEADVHRNPIEPCSKGRTRPETAQSAIRPDEDVLRQIAGVLVVAHEAVAELVHLPAVSLDDDVEGAGTAAERGVDEGLLVRGFPIRIHRARLEGSVVGSRLVARR